MFENLLENDTRIDFMVEKCINLPDIEEYDGGWRDN